MSSITLKRVRKACETGANGIEVALFADETGRVCGWFIGPVRINRAGIDMVFLPRSERTIASVAVVRAIEAARRTDLPLYVIDPDDLWNHAWNG